VPPELLFVIKPSLHPMITALYGVVVVVALVILLPWVLRDKMGAFWLTAMLLAAIPVSSLAPLSKNFGFVAIGAYGLMASFMAGLLTNRLPNGSGYRSVAWIACGLFFLAHVPGAIAERIITAKSTSFLFAQVNQIPRNWPGIENENVIVINYPCPLAAGYVPAYKAYFDQPLPRTLRALAPGCTSLNVQRTDDKTLLIQSQGPDIFSCDDAGPIDGTYIFSNCNLLLDAPECKTGDRFDLNGLTVEVLESDAAGLPSRVSFRFETSLDSPEFRWFWFDWRTFSAKPLKMPAIGQSVMLSGP
jgi:hypothetical protein